MNNRSRACRSVGAAAPLVLLGASLIAAPTPPTAAPPASVSTGPEIERSWRTTCVLGDIEVRMSVSRAQATVADRVELILEAAMPPGVRIAWPEELQRIEGLNQLVAEEAELPDAADSRKRVRRVTILEPFLPGERRIEPMVVRFADARGTSCEVRTEAVTIEVVSVLGEGEPPEPELRGIVEPSEGPGLTYWLVIAAPPALAMGGLLWLALRKRRAGPQRVLTPYEAALRRLDELDQAGLHTTGRSGEYAATLGDIVRRHVAGELGLPDADRTTEQLLGEIAGRADLNVQSLADLLGRLDEAGFSGSGLGSVGEAQELRDRAHKMIVGLHSARAGAEADAAKGGG